MTNYDRSLSRLGADTKSNKIEYATRRKANADLRKAGFDGNDRFRTMGAALNTMTSVLSRHGIELDDVPNAHLFMADQKAVNFNLAWSNSEDSFSPVSIENSVLHISYTKLREDAYEVVAYLS